MVLFDGECNLCSGAVQFVIRRDPRARMRFAALRSQAAERLLAGVASPPPRPLPDSIVLIAGDRAFLRSAAALRIAGLLRWPWPLLTVFLVVPRPLRDLAYDFVARRRHRWFGRPASCWVPSPALRARFLDVGLDQESGGSASSG